MRRTKHQANLKHGEKMTEETKPDVTQNALLEMIATMQANNSNSSKESGKGSGRRSSRRNESEFVIKSVSVPVMIETRREKTRTFVNCEGEFRSEEDIENLFDALYDMGFNVETWEKKEQRNDRDSRNSGGGGGYKNNRNGYQGGGNYNRNNNSRY